MAKVRPLGDRILVKVVGRERTTLGGVVLPDNVREESDRGLVVAVGPGEPFLSSFDDARMELRQGQWQNREMPVQVGEVVVFSPYAGSKVAVGKDDFLLLREHDILGVLDGAEVVEGDDGLRIREREAVTV